MNDRLQELREIGWRRQWTAAEINELRAWFAAHPDDAAAWEAEGGLNEALESLPTVPVSSNFTARVLEAIERDATAAGRAARPRAPWWHWLLPKAAVALFVGAIGVFTYFESVEHRHRKLTEQLQSVAVISGVSSLPSPEVLLHFDEIREFNGTQPDKGLLAVLPLLQ